VIYIKNELIYEGRIIDITYKSNKIIKFVMANEKEFNHKKIKVCCFNSELFSIIESNVMNVVNIKAEFSENNYKDKNGKWHNDYTVACYEIEVE